MRLKQVSVNQNYIVTDDGRVFNSIRGNELKPFKNPKGYDLVRLGKKDTYLLHRLVAKAFVYNSNPDEFNQVNHIDGVKTNNHYTNLEWTNNSGNQLHAFANGLNNPQRGSKNVNARLTEAMVQDACSMFEEGLSTPEVARRLGDYSLRHSLRQVREHKNWKHISIKYNF
jgi:hypothetical protein